jgi:hypothetical protein
MATNDPNSAGCKRHDGRSSDSGCARPNHRSRHGSHVDELEDPCPLPARKLLRNAQNGFGFCIGLAPRQEGKGIRVIRIDAELLSERTSLGQLDRNEAKMAGDHACTVKERGRIGPTARLIRCRRERAWPLPKRLSRRSMEDGRWQINALMQPSLVGGRINHHMLGSPPSEDHSHGCCWRRLRPFRCGVRRQNRKVPGNGDCPSEQRA